MAGSFTGYRATVLGTRSTYSILCQCRYSDWPTLKPAFDRMIKSLTIRDASQVAVPAPLPPMTVLPAPAVPVYNPVSQPAQPVQPAQPSSESSPPGAAVSVLPTPIPGSASQRTITAPDQPFIPAYGVSSQAPETGVGQTDPAQSMRPEPSSTNDPPANSGPN
jgi:hypothetical protein